MGLLGLGSDVSARPRASEKIVAKRLPQQKRAQARKNGQGAAVCRPGIFYAAMPKGAQPRDFLILLEDTTHETHEE
jgi:hypothetical protein